MPTDLTALREAWERAQALSVDKSELIPYIGVYGGNLTTTQANDLARRAYDRGRADAVADARRIVDELLAAVAKGASRG